MNKFKNWLRKTFTGIYGFDKLYMLLIGTVIGVAFVNVFVRHWSLWIVELLLLSYAVFRTMSHNYRARKRENDLVFGFFKNVKKFFVLQKNRFRDRKTHIYRKCPKCRVTLRLPKAKGKHTVLCPRCHNKFTVK